MDIANTLVAAPSVEMAARTTTAADPSNHGKRIGILIVAYNAVTTLGKVLNRIPQEVRRNVEEIVVFDDASSDHTTDLAVGYKIRNEFSKLTVIRNDVNLGYGGNQKKGYQYFIDKNFDVVILLHGDGQYAPELLASMYAPIVSEQADAVFGSRMMKTYGGPLKGGMPLYKYLGNRILTTFENASLSMNLTEFHSGYRAYNLHALRKINFGSLTNDFHFDTEIIIKLNHQNFRIAEVPIPTYYGDEICYVNGMKYAKDVYKAVKRYKQTMYSFEVHPEFAEYHVHYPRKEGDFSSHYWLSKLVGSKNTVLDVGCGEGFLAKQFAEAGNQVTGVDILEKAALQFSMNNYICADLEDGLTKASSELSGQKFDFIVLADILEHLKNPDKLVNDCRNLLASNGRIIISVPNIVNFYIRAQVLFGSFNYTNRGILDKTHLRFFTKKTILEFLTQNGFEPISYKASIVPIEMVLNTTKAPAITRLLTKSINILTSAFPTFFGYQHIIVAKAKRY